MTLTPSSSCMWVPLCSKPATCCFDTAREEIGRRAVVYFWWKTSTNCNCYDGVTVTTDAAGKGP